jgi:hypothetical protein
MILIECEQGEPEWFRARAGAITASNVSEIRKRLKSGPNKGGFTTAAESYAFKLAVERLKGEPIDQDQFETFAMRRGHELEHEARLLHEERLGVFIEQAGICLTDDRKFGFSTDGFIGEDGVSEYKCFLDSTKVRKILFHEETEEVMDQVQNGLWITGRDWCDFTLYYPDLKCVGLELTIQRIDRDEEYIEAMVEDLLEFDKLVESYHHRILDLVPDTSQAAFEPSIHTDLGDLF